MAMQKDTYTIGEYVIEKWGVEMSAALCAEITYSLKHDDNETPLHYKKMATPTSQPATVWSCEVLERHQNEIKDIYDELNDEFLAIENSQI